MTLCECVCVSLSVQLFPLSRRVTYESLPVFSLSLSLFPDHGPFDLMGGQEQQREEERAMRSLMIACPFLVVVGVDDKPFYKPLSLCCVVAVAAPSS